MQKSSYYKMEIKTWIIFFNRKVVARERKEVIMWLTKRRRELRRREKPNDNNNNVGEWDGEKASKCWQNRAKRRDTDRENRCKNQKNVCRIDFQVSSDRQCTRNKDLCSMLSFSQFFLPHLPPDIRREKHLETGAAGKVAMLLKSSTDIDLNCKDIRGLQCSTVYLQENHDDSSIFPQSQFSSPLTLYFTYPNANNDNNNVPRKRQSVKKFKYGFNTRWFLTVISGLKDASALFFWLIRHCSASIPIFPSSTLTVSSFVWCWKEIGFVWRLEKKNRNTNEQNCNPFG